MTPAHAVLTYDVSIMSITGSECTSPTILTYESALNAPHRPLRPLCGHPWPGYVRPAYRPSLHSSRQRAQAPSRPHSHRPRAASVGRVKPCRALREVHEGDAAASAKRRAASRRAQGDTAQALCARPTSVAARLRRTRAQSHGQSTRPHARPTCSRATREVARSIAVLGRTLMN